MSKGSQQKRTEMTRKLKLGNKVLKAANKNVCGDFKQNIKSKHGEISVER